MKTVEKNKNNQISWLGIRLTKKRSIYLTIFSSIGGSFLAVSIFFAVPVLIYAKTNIYQRDKIIYTYTLLLSISKFLACAICVGIFFYSLSKAKAFRKSVKNQ